MPKTTTVKVKTPTKFDLRNEAAKGLYAGAGAADLAVAAVKEYVAEVQKDVSGRVEDVQKTVTSLTPKNLRKQAVSAVNTRVESVTEGAKTRVAEVQALPTKVQGLVEENVATASETYSDLAKRGESVVKRIRNQPETKEAVAEAKTAVAKAKTTATQAKKTADTAKKSAASTRKAVAKKATPAKSSAKATVTTAKKAATSAVKAAEVAVDKAGETPTKTTAPASKTTTNS